MQARDVMTTTAVTVPPDATIPEIAQRLLARRVSAVPVVDPEGRLLGIVSEGDLVRRPETGTLRPLSWWLKLLASPEERAFAYVKSHGGHARDVMTRDVVSVGEEASLAEIAGLLEKRRIKRVPVVRDGQLRGIVSRADLLHGLIAEQAAPAVPAGDPAIRAAIDAALGARRETLTWAYEVQHVASALSLVAAGLGPAIMPRLVPTVPLPRRGTCQPTTVSVQTDSCARASIVCGLWALRLLDHDETKQHESYALQKVIVA